MARVFQTYSWQDKIIEVRREMKINLDSLCFTDIFLCLLDGMEAEGRHKRDLLERSCDDSEKNYGWK